MRKKVYRLFYFCINQSCKYINYVFAWSFLRLNMNPPLILTRKSWVRKTCTWVYLNFSYFSNMQSRKCSYFGRNATFNFFYFRGVDWNEKTNEDYGRKECVIHATDNWFTRSKKERLFKHVHAYRYTVIILYSIQIFLCIHSYD